MAKRIIVLEKTGPGAWRFLLWVDVPAGREPYWLERQGHPTASVWLGASAAENAEIAAGRVVESAESYSRPDAATMVDAQADLETRWQVYQDEVTAFNPWNRYGSFWDGTDWTLGGVS